MEVRVEFSPELEAEITKRAASASTDPAAIIRELVTASIEADQMNDQEAVAGIQQGLDELTAGQGRPATEFLAELRRTHDLSREHPAPGGTGRARHPRSTPLPHTRDTPGCRGS